MFFFCYAFLFDKKKNWFGVEWKFQFNKNNPDEFLRILVLTLLAVEFVVAV